MCILYLQVNIRHHHRVAVLCARLVDVQIQMDAHRVEVVIMDIVVQLVHCRLQSFVSYHLFIIITWTYYPTQMHDFVCLVLVKICKLSKNLHISSTLCIVKVGIKCL